MWALVEGPKWVFFSFGIAGWGFLLELGGGDE